MFGSLGHAKNGWKQVWVAIFDTLGKKFEVTSFRINGLNNSIAGAATFIYHATDIDTFFCQYKENLNTKLESVLAHNQSVAIPNFYQALGILYYKATCLLLENFGKWCSVIGLVQVCANHVAALQRLVKGIYITDKKIRWHLSTVLLKSRRFFMFYSVDDDELTTCTGTNHVILIWLKEG